MLRIRPRLLTLARVELLAQKDQVFLWFMIQGVMPKDHPCPPTSQESVRLIVPAWHG